MARADDGLRPLFRKHLPEVHWQAIETGATGRGVPDLNGCYRGREVWVECKRTRGVKLDIVDVSPEQVAWAEARYRAGGNVFLAVRRRGLAKRINKIPARVDQLWIFRYHMLRYFRDGGRMTEKHGICMGDESPARWRWEDIRDALLTPPSYSL